MTATVPDSSGSQPPLRAALLPTPRTVTWGEGALVLDTVSTQVAFRGVEDADKARLHRLLRFLPQLIEVQSEEHAAVTFQKDEALGDEEYELIVTSTGVRISASTANGWHYGIQTLKQLMPAEVYRRDAGHDGVVPFCEIRDAPALAWRGALLDVARHFFPKRFVLDLIDSLALHKYNRLQLHLTDDQGWRLPSTRWPRLNTTGATRSATQISHFDEPLVLDDTPHGGFYSFEDLREMISYASDRGITVIPEIELPGHSGALLAAYPQLGLSGMESKVSTIWGVSDSLVSPLPAAEADLLDILAEVLEIFPSAWIHLGGDESRTQLWADSPVVQEFMRASGTTSVRELFSDFMNRLDTWLGGRGRTLVCWDDAFANSAGLSDTAVVTAWRSLDVARNAAANGLNVILSPFHLTYFDYYQEADAREPLAIGGPIRWEDVATFDPLPAHWDVQSRSRVLGGQFQLWTELIDSEQYAEYMIWPRAAVLAQALWTGQPAGSVPALRTMLERHLPRLAAMGTRFRPLDGPHPWQQAGSRTKAFRAGDPIAAIQQGFADAARAGVVADSSPDRSPDAGSGRSE